jgi:hypothetical protein
VTTNGKGKIIRHNALNNRITVRLDGGLEMEIGVDQIRKEEASQRKERDSQPK